MPGTVQYFLTIFFVESTKESVRDRNENPSGKKIVVKSPTAMERHRYL